MAVTPVSIGPGLRGWFDSGLTHILLDGTVAEFEAAAVSGNRTAVAGSSPALQRVSGGVLPATPPAGAVGPHAKAEPTSSPVVSLPQQEPKGKSVSGMVSLTFAASKDISGTPADWPEPWAGWFAKLSPAAVLWTYHELGADVTGVGRSPERSGFLKHLIGDLGLPKGSSVFWPSAMPSPSDSVLRADAPLFAAGLRLLMPRIVVVFGDSALEDMGLAGKVTQFGQIMVEGKLLVLLPDIEDFLRGGAQRSSAGSLLRVLFSTISFG